MKRTPVAVTRFVAAMWGVVLSAGMCAQAATINYYRFEDTPGFLADSSDNNYTLTANSATQVDKPALFPSPIPLTGAANAKAADIALGGYLSGATAVSGSFTLETFISPDNYDSAWCLTVAKGENAFQLQVRTDQYLLSPDNVPWITIFSGGDVSVFRASSSNPDPNWSLIDGHDYYMAAAFTQNGTGVNETVTFYLMDLTTGGPLLSSVTEAFSGATDFTMNSAAILNIGLYEYGQTFDGRIDEVRLSSGVLSPNELLFIPIPEPASLTLLGLAGLVMMRRQR